MSLINFQEHFDNAYEEIFNKVLVGKSIANFRFEKKLKYGESVERFAYDISGVKTDFEERYNKEDYTAHLAGAEKRLKEMEAQDGVYVAKYENVARNHPFVLEESEERRNAIWLYHENFVASKLIGQQIKGGYKAIS